MVQRSWSMALQAILRAEALSIKNLVASRYDKFRKMAQFFAEQ
jgi:hypothetical protein